MPNETNQSQIANRKSAIPYWYPFKTDNGAMREDRIVFPIPPGTHWSEVKPVVVPTAGRLEILPEPGPDAARKRSRGTQKPRKGQTEVAASAPPVRHTITRGSALRFGSPVPSAPSAPLMLPAPVKPVKTPRKKKPAARIDPVYLKGARELRDRYLERVNETSHGFASCGKYDVSRILATARDSASSLSLASHPLPKLPAAA